MPSIYNSKADDIAYFALLIIICTVMVSAVIFCI